MTAEKIPPRLISMRSFAKKCGTNHSVVVRAIQTGRLERSIRWIRGRPVIVDEALALREWRENTNPLMSPKWRAANP